MNRRIAFALLVLALSGCSLIEPPEAAPGTPQRLCEDAADSDPKVRDFWATTPSGSNPSEFNDQYRAARARAVAECLRVRSGRPRGGVERLVK